MPGPAPGTNSTRHPRRNSKRRSRNGGQTKGMKTTVSIPDDVFARAERLARLTGLPKDSVANVSQIVTLDKDLFTERVGKLPGSKLRLILYGLT